MPLGSKTLILSIFNSKDSFEFIIASNSVVKPLKWLFSDPCERHYAIEGKDPKAYIFKKHHTPNGVIVYSIEEYGYNGEVPYMKTLLAFNNFDDLYYEKMEEFERLKKTLGTAI